MHNLKYKQILRSSKRLRFIMFGSKSSFLRIILLLHKRNNLFKETPIKWIVIFFCYFSLPPYALTYVSPAPAAYSRIYCARCHPWTRSQVSRFYHAAGDARRQTFFFSPHEHHRNSFIYLSIFLTHVQEMYRNGWRRACNQVRVGVEQSVNVRRRRERRRSLELKPVCRG